MKMDKPCNLDVPSGATPMTIADAILRELDEETLDEVMYYIGCFRYKKCKGEIKYDPDLIDKYWRK